MKAPRGRSTVTRSRILQVAADLFHKQGVRATSPDEIIEASRTGKGQFYHYFKSKDGLVHEVLQTHLKAIQAGTGPVNYAVDSWEDLERWFLAHIQLQQRFNMTRGCPFGTVANEVAEGDELIRQDLSLIFELMKHKLATFFTKEKAHGRLAAETDADQLADFCIAAIQGGMLVGKVRRDSRPVEMAAREALANLRRYVLGPANH